MLSLVSSAGTRTASKSASRTKGIGSVCDGFELFYIFSLSSAGWTLLFTPVDGTTREVSCEQPRLPEAVQAVRTHVCVAIVLSAAGDESGQVPDEQVVKLAFADGNHQQVDVMLPVAVLGCVEWKDFVVFKNQDVDANGGV